jgi:hypothetical protein
LQGDIFYALYDVKPGIPKWIWLAGTWTFMILGCISVGVAYLLGAVYQVFSKDIKLTFEKAASLNYNKLEGEICDDPMRALRWAQNRGLLRNDCPLCYQKVNPEFSPDEEVSYDGRLTCPSCTARVQFLDCSWFDPLDIDVWKAVGVMYHWASGSDIKKASKRLLLDDDTTASWYLKCMEVSQCTFQLCFSDTIVADRDHYRSHRLTIACPHYRIGGGGKIVEFKIAKKGEIFKNYAVVAAVERGSLRSIVLPTKLVNPRSILSFVKERVLDGTKIMSRYFEDANVHLPAGQYTNFHVPDAVALESSKGGRHQHSLRDRATGEAVHMDTAEEMFDFLKTQLAEPSQRNVATPIKLLTIYSTQFVWRKTYVDDDDEAFGVFVGHVRRAFPAVNAYYDSDGENEEEEEEEPLMPSQAGGAKFGGGDVGDDDDEEEGEDEGAEGEGAAAAVGEEDDEGEDEGAEEE